MSKTYHLSYDVFGTNLTPTQLQGFLAESRRVTGWYQPFAGSVFIKSNDTAAGLREGFRAILGDALFVISLVDVFNMTGALPPTVWEWIYRDDEGFAAIAASGNVNNILG